MSKKSFKKYNLRRQNSLRPVKIEKYSGIDYANKLKGLTPPLRYRRYKISDEATHGDAPKDFIERKSKKYIAKVGHKWYPIESITEHLMNCIGVVMGLKMAKSELVDAHGQIRFLSKYFLTKSESLVHGAELYSAYLEEVDNSFVDMIEKENRAREFFTFQVSIDALEKQYPNHYKEIVAHFVKMLVFDAIVGNNDRHFYNWGIIENIYGNAAEFSPIYDTARGLFWNESEKKIEAKFFIKNEIKEETIRNYNKKSRPKIGWDGNKNINHFQLISNINKADSSYKAICYEMLQASNLRNILNYVDSDFANFLSAKRRYLIKCCLQLRFNELQKSCGL